MNIARSSKFEVGDMIMPKAEWKDDPNCIPSGRIVKIEPFGKDGAIYVEGERRAFAAYVFDRDEGGAQE